MFPPTCSQPPCRNIIVKSDAQTGMLVPGMIAVGAWVTAAGTRANASLSWPPSDRSARNTTTLRTISSTVTTGKVRLGISSLSGITGTGLRGFRGAADC